MVTYEGLFQFSLVMIGVATLSLSVAILIQKKK